MKTAFIKTAPASEWMSTQQAAEELGGVTPAQVSRWCAEGLIKGSARFPGRTGWRIPRRAWDQFIKSRIPS